MSAYAVHDSDRIINIGASVCVVFTTVALFQYIVRDEIDQPKNNNFFPAKIHRTIPMLTGRFSYSRDVPVREILSQPIDIEASILHCVKVVMFQMYHYQTEQYDYKSFT